MATFFVCLGTSFLLIRSFEIQLFFGVVLWFRSVIEIISSLEYRTVEIFSKMSVCGHFVKTTTVLRFKLEAPLLEVYEKLKMCDSPHTFRKKKKNKIRWSFDHTAKKSLTLAKVFEFSLRMSEKLFRLPSLFFCCDWQPRSRKVTTIWNRKLLVIFSLFWDSWANGKRLESIWTTYGGASGGSWARQDVHLQNKQYLYFFRRTVKITLKSFTKIFSNTNF